MPQNVKYLCLHMSRFQTRDISGSFINVIQVNPAQIVSIVDRDLKRKIIMTKKKEEELIRIFLIILAQVRRGLSKI